MLRHNCRQDKLPKCPEDSYAKPRKTHAKLTFPVLFSPREPPIHIPVHAVVLLLRRGPACCG